MNPHDIQAAIKKAGSSQKEISEELKIHNKNVNVVIHGKGTSRRVAKHIADKIGKTVDEIWPGRYGHDKKAVKFKPTARSRAAA